MTNSVANPPTLSGPVKIPVTVFAYPPNAPQPGEGTSYLIDTSDCRFINASTQIDNSLFRVYTIASGSYCPSRVL